MIQIESYDPEQKRYWRSLGQLHGTPEFKEWVHGEFSESAASPLDAQSRRNMLKLMGASFGLAGLTACRRPEEKILPNARGVEDYVPSRPYYYSTAMSLGGTAIGLLAEVNEGRPTKIEGNPEHPLSLGKSGAFHQASVLDLYNPNRSQSPMKKGEATTWDEFYGFASQYLLNRAGQGQGLRILSGAVTSPSLLAIRTHLLQKFPAAKWVEYEPVALDAASEGARLAFRQPAVPVYNLEKADVIVSLDSDCLGVDCTSPRMMMEYANRRRNVEGEAASMSRLYVVEHNFTVTGATADSRLRLRASEVREFAKQMAAQLGQATGLSIVNNGGNDRRRRFLSAIVKDLGQARGRSVVLVGPRQPAEVHALGYLLNQALGNTGQTVTYVRPPQVPAQSQLDALRTLTGEMSGGQVQVLMVLGANPVFTAPADLGFADALKKVENSVHMGVERDETSVAATWYLPEAHYLESWGDARAADGTSTIQQPMIQPLFGGRTCAEVLANLSEYKDRRPYDIVHNYWASQFGTNGEIQWRTALHDGVIANTRYSDVAVTVDTARVVGALNQPVRTAQGIEVAFYPSANVYDGRFANNAWMQEASEPMTKLTWDNAALMSPATAKRLGVYRDYNNQSVNDDYMIEIERGGRRLEIPVLAQPGHADEAISIPLGYGRSECGDVGKGRGFNAYQIRTTDAFGFGTGFNVRKLTRMYKLATTQEHHSMEGRPLLRETTLSEYKEEPEVVQEMAEVPQLFSLYDETTVRTGTQWGMAIDLNTCIGCNACMVACQAENNIPVVGKAEVLRGREMHWIRMDRYYISRPGEEEEPEAIQAPIPCMHCENAPCENVCPVNATVHSPDGLNDMAYNRCVGTRYCSNNCPYKVRRFNYINYHKEPYAQQEKVYDRELQRGASDTQRMVFNPEVSVRMRGVMEKCTYCTQRIREKQIQAHQENRRDIRDGEVVPACAQSCPTDCIVFGNINDPNARVAKLRTSKRNYAMLAELNVKPRTTYLAKLRNPHPDLAHTRENEHHG